MFIIVRQNFINSIFLLLVLIFSLSSCRNETQNRLRRQVQGLTGGKMYITLYSATGTAIFQGEVNGKVTRADTNGSGDYIFWYDSNGEYYQTNLSYLLTSKQP